MTPEERARACWLAMTGPATTETIVAGIAASIRSAEDDALERAAEAVEAPASEAWITPSRRMQAERIRSLKSKK